MWGPTPGETAAGGVWIYLWCIDADDPHYAVVPGTYSFTRYVEVYACKESASEVEKYGSCDLPTEPDYIEPVSVKVVVTE